MCSASSLTAANDNLSPAQRHLLEVDQLKKYFPVRQGLLKYASSQIRAVDGVSFAIRPGETLCLVGESGSGKSTVGRLVLRLIEPTSGTVRFDGQDITRLGREELRAWRKRMQIVFQDPYSSLNPRLTAGKIVAEPLENFPDTSARERRERVANLFERVGLRPEMASRYPFEFSGGQRQRLGLARALALNPALIVADEPVSALDVSVQAQVLNLMMDLQQDLKLAYLFISHDLGVVEHIAQRVAVMYLGRIVEIADKEELFARPLHPYTRALLAAAPVANPRAQKDRIVLEGDIPSPISPPPGCHFHTRCPFAFARCRTEAPLLRDAGGARRFACHLDP
jgi:oligopeptide/dipeptide ABC transporter ATP-binding protein